MHDFTAKGSLIHFSGYCSLQQIIVLIYELLRRLGHYYCIEVIYMQDAEFILHISPSEPEARGSNSNSNNSSVVLCLLSFPGCRTLHLEGGSIVIYF